MSTPRFLADEDLRHPIVLATRRLEPAIEFSTVRDQGWSGFLDPQVLESAAANGWIVVTHDANTMTAEARRRLATGQLMTGLLVAHQWRPTQEVAESLLLLIWSASQAEEWVGPDRLSSDLRPSRADGAEESHRQMPAPDVVPFNSSAKRSKPHGPAYRSAVRRANSRTFSANSGGSSTVAPGP